MSTKRSVRWSGGGFGFTFVPQLLPTLFLLLGLPVLISLGHWQWCRAADKQRLITQLQNGQILPFRSIIGASFQALQYRSTQVTGRYDAEHTVLLDNQIWQHRVGYAVLTPFIPSETAYPSLLVNRGWIPKEDAALQRSLLPSSGEQTIRGLIQVLPQHAFALGQPVTTLNQRILVQSLDRHVIKGLYSKPLAPFIILLSPLLQDGFVREWHPIILTPARHRAYSIQWFALAVVLVIMYLILSVRRHGSMESTGKENGKKDKT